MLIIIFNCRADAQREYAVEIFDHVVESKLLAENAVQNGDDTLKKANSTYHLLQSFQSEVQKSSQSAQIALEEVPSINDQIKVIEKVIRDTEQVIRDNFF